MISTLFTVDPIVDKVVEVGCNMWVGWWKKELSSAYLKQRSMGRRNEDDQKEFG